MNEPGPHAPPASGATSGHVGRKHARSVPTHVHWPPWHSQSIPAPWEQYEQPSPSATQAPVVGSAGHTSPPSPVPGPDELPPPLLPPLLLLTPMLPLLLPL